MKINSVLYRFADLLLGSSCGLGKDGTRQVWVGNFYVRCIFSWRFDAQNCSLLSHRLFTISSLSFLVSFTHEDQPFVKQFCNKSQQGFDAGINNSRTYWLALFFPNNVNFSLQFRLIMPFPAVCTLSLLAVRRLDNFNFVGFCVNHCFCLSQAMGKTFIFSHEQSYLMQFSFFTGK